MAEKDPITRIKELEAEKSKLIESAKSEALARAKQAVADLNELGFRYSLTQGEGKGRKGERKIQAEKPCSICGFQTNPRHDARKHRSQGKRKRAFTSKELSDFGLRKVA
jgi:hypothetical protein